MIVYALEFALLHIVFFLVYKLMLSGETHLTFRRYFLLASTVLALVIPLVSLPETQQIPNIELEALFLPTFSTAEIPTSASINIPWIYGLLIIPGSYWIFRIATGVYHIFSLVRRSDEKVMCGVPVRLLSELSQSFSFFRWIFVNCTDEQHAEPIIRHELGHVKICTHWTCCLSTLCLLFFGGYPLFG